MPQMNRKEYIIMMKKILNHLREGLILTGEYLNYMTR